MPDQRAPDAPPEQPDAALGVAAVARRLGVATGTLRTWDRRYGLGPSEHQSGSRRRYSRSDLARLDLMRRLMLEGVTPAEAARVACTSTLADAPGSLHEHERILARRNDRGAGGGRVVALRDGSPAARGLARAAMSLDADACTAMLSASLDNRGVVPTWNDVLLPVLAGVGDRWRSTGNGVEVEHLLSESAETALRAAARRTPAAAGTRPVLLAALETEAHRLPLVALSAALAERGVPARLLGVRLPLAALADAVVRTGPGAVFLWSSGVVGRDQLPRPEQLGAVRPRPALILGGPGWADERWRSGATWVGDLEEAVRTLRECTAGPLGVPAHPAR